MRPNLVAALTALALGAAVPPLAASGAQPPVPSPSPQPVPRQSYDTRRTATPPTVDGRLDDEVWAGVEWSGEFVQREPDEGKPPSHQTRFKVLYDDAAVYFAVRAYDDPQKVSKLLARRDSFPGDWVEINIDSYFDRRTAFSFTLSLSGTRGDEAVSNDGKRWDANWDPVWQGATQVDAEGWTAEVRVPLSQLRFSSAEKQTWGLQVQRRIFSKEERSVWQVIPKDVTGWVSRFGELRGIEGIRPRRRVELVPYGVVRGERFEREDGNPFRDGTAADASIGLDGTVGLTSDLTATFTLNPDFGQVEADPSEVNLTAFETFFAEKRPFFVEGNDIFELRLAPAITGGHFTNDRLFYSRRVGGRPPYSPELADGAFADEPSSTSILGAFKLSGKTSTGLSIGILDSVTSRETAEIDEFGLRRRETVTPLSNNFVGRVQQDFRGGDTQVGGMLTAVHRDVDAGPLAFLTTQAYAGGADFAHYLGARAYLVEGNLMASHLRGSARAIEDVQTAPARYFQRPDNEEAELDPTRTSLGGHAGSLRLTRTASNSRFRFQTGGAWRSPGFEINDLGFMRRADEINQFGWAAYQIRNPFSIFRRLDLNVNEWMDWDFGGNFLRAATNTNAHAHFKNNMRLGGNLTRDFESLSNTELRGGPASRWPAVWSGEVYAGTDARKKLNAFGGTWWRSGDEESEKTRGYWLELSLRPTNALTLFAGPSWTGTERETQYVGTHSVAGDPRYLFGRLDQETLSVILRADLALTPNLTIQFYGAPFVSSGTYAGFKRMVDPRANTYASRFRSLDRVSLDDGTYTVDEDGDGNADYSFGRPDFDFGAFNSTLVARWEYRPGSQVYLVWSQAREDSLLRPGQLAVGRGLGDLFESYPHDVFLIKFSRWLSF